MARRNPYPPLPRTPGPGERPQPPASFRDQMAHIRARSRHASEMLAGLVSEHDVATAQLTPSALAHLRRALGSYHQAITELEKQC